MKVTRHSLLEKDKAKPSSKRLLTHTRLFIMLREIQGRRPWVFFEGTFRRSVRWLRGDEASGPVSRLFRRLIAVLISSLLLVSLVGILLFIKGIKE